MVNPSLAKRGEYQLRVHVIEARGLVGRDAGGTCDPQVYVKAFGKERRTSTKNKEVSPVWDENVFIVAKDIDYDTLSSTSVELRVMDVDLLSSNDLVGLYSVDCAFLYYQPNHELHRQWLVLSAPYEARKGGWFEADARGGAQGYLCVSMTLLGPGDTPVVHDDDEDDNRLGLLWEKVGASKPSRGYELTNEKLSEALQAKGEFSKEVWASFGIKGLLTTHFIKSGDMYFKPRVTKEMVENPDGTIAHRQVALLTPPAMKQVGSCYLPLKARPPHPSRLATYCLSQLVARRSWSSFGSASFAPAGYRIWIGPSSAPGMRAASWMPMCTSISRATTHARGESSRIPPRGTPSFGCPSCFRPSDSRSDLMDV